MGLFSKLKKVIKKADPIGSKIASKTVGKSPLVKKVTGGSAGAQSGLGRLQKVTGGAAPAKLAPAARTMSALAGTAKPRRRGNMEP